MRVLVLSDTHASNLNELPSDIQTEIDTVDLIIHLGDYTKPELMEELSATGKFKGVSGNMDPEYIRHRLPDTENLKINGLKFVLVHGWGSPAGLEERIIATFAKEKPDLILHGHSHLSRNSVFNGVSILNPGSATGKYPAQRKTYCVLTIADTGSIQPTFYCP